MACSYCTQQIEQYGADPANIQWSVVRGDSAELRVDFLLADEVTSFATSDWSFKATAYDPRTDILDELTVINNDGYVIVKASADITNNWGSKYSSIVAELQFDIEATIPDGSSKFIWTPIIGTICVRGDVTGGSL